MVPLCQEDEIGMVTGSREELVEATAQDTKTVEHLPLKNLHCAKTVKRLYWRLTARRGNTLSSQGIRVTNSSMS